MRRRDLIILLAGAALARRQEAFAQSRDKVYRVGLLSPTDDKSPFEAPMVNGLAQHGYELNRNLVIERRAPALLAELVSSKVEVIIALGYAAAMAVKQDTTLPSVVISAGDPVGIGLVESMARPGGHITGISDVSVEVTPKRLQLLKEFAPNLRRVAMLWNADNPGMTLRYQAAETGARSLGIGVQPLGVREPADFDAAFEEMNRAMPDAILMVSDTLTTLNRKKVFDFAVAHRLPAIYEYDFIVRDGGLMSFGVDLDEAFDRVGALVDRIIKGASPADLPFEDPTRFVFAFNLGTARSMGFEPSAEFLARADEVIE